MGYPLQAENAKFYNTVAGKHSAAFSSLYLNLLFTASSSSAPPKGFVI